MTAGKVAWRLRRIKQRQRIVILRDDHIGDPIGVMFLDPSAEDEDSLFERLRDYLGKRLRVVRVELTTERAEVEVEVQAFVRGGEPSCRNSQ
jgi:hypothetical protein